MRKEAMLYEKLGDKKLRCLLCSHFCIIAELKYGFCGVRQNIDGTLYSHVYGEVIANHVDPVEKKPLYHFLPNSRSYSIATVGCNFRCGFCQNWQISQFSKAERSDLQMYELKPQEVIRECKKNQCASISYTYTEPTIFFEYAYDTARLAKQEGIYNIFVTNGFMSQAAIDTIRPYLHAANIDLKAFSDETYQKACHGRLEPVLNSIRHMKKIGIWVEITTLVVPGVNDKVQELREIAHFIAGLGVEIPWHISRFHPDYKYLDYEVTPLEILREAYKIGKDAGLRYVYLGNVREATNTICYKCGELLIARDHIYRVKSNLDGNRCPKCKALVDGLFV